MKTLLAAVLSFFVAGCALLPEVVTPRVSTFAQLRQATYQLIGDEGSCSAVLIAPEKALTAAHCDQTNLKINGKSAILIKKNETADLMLLFVDNLECPCVPIASSFPALDTFVATIGYPLGLGQVLTEGRVQDLTIDVPEAAHVFLITSPVVFGNSGGPVFAKENGEYRVVGILSGVAVASLGGFPNLVTHLAFAVRTDVIQGFLKDGVSTKQP